jgi:hypothetical protein
VVRLHVLDIVKLNEFPAVIRGDEGLEFAQRLLAERVPVNQEENTPRAGTLDEAVGKIAGGKRFSGSRWPFE